MPSKRTLLDLLTRNELLDVADRYHLTVQDRRVKDQLVEAAVSSRAVSLSEVLSTFPRDRLQDLWGTD